MSLWRKTENMRQCSSHRASGMLRRSDKLCGRHSLIVLICEKSLQSLPGLPSLMVI